MPELPEVEVVRRQLARVVVSRTIGEVWTAKNSYFFVTPPKKLASALSGRRIDALERHGKYLLFLLDDGARLLAHLGMTGQITTRPLEKDAHVHLLVQLGPAGRTKTGATLTFRDVRKFGKVEWIAPGKSSPRLDKLGPDALGLDGDLLFECTRRRKIPIKSALLDQSITAGVGNIYADEALFDARIRPTRAAHTLRRAEADVLARAVTAILSTSVSRGGSTINDYIQPDGELGGFQDFHRVYGKTGQPCPNCGAPLVRVVLGGRSTHYCKVCQK